MPVVAAGGPASAGKTTLHAPLPAGPTNSTALAVVAEAGIFVAGQSPAPAVTAAPPRAHAAARTIKTTWAGIRRRARACIVVLPRRGTGRPRVVVASVSAYDVSKKQSLQVAMV
jgi:hypothetical protein